MGRSGAARRRSRKRRAEGRPPRRPAPPASDGPVAVIAGSPARPVARPGHRRTIERPQAPWHPVPVTEIVMLAGLVSFFVGLGSGRNGALVVGIVLLLLATLELTAREHFAGFRSHALVLALILTVALEALLYEVAGSIFTGPVALAVIVPVFVALFFLFRGRYKESREARSIGR